MYQFYVVEIQQYTNGEYGHIVHYAFDENADKAQLKAESKYYEVLSAAAISELPSHAAILFSTEGFPLKHECYKHNVSTPEPENSPEDATDENLPGNPIAEAET